MKKSTEICSFVFSLLNKHVKENIYFYIPDLHTRVQYFSILVFSVEPAKRKQNIFFNYNSFNHNILMGSAKSKVR